MLGLTIDVHNELHHISVPPDLKALVLVSTIIMGVWILVLALGIAGRLAKHLDSLFALGVNRRWAGKVLALSLFPTLIPAILTGMASGYVGVWILTTAGAADGSTAGRHIVANLRVRCPRAGGGACPGVRVGGAADLQRKTEMRITHVSNHPG